MLQGLELTGITLGAEYKPTDHAYIRVEGRNLSIDKRYYCLMKVPAITALNGWSRLDSILTDNPLSEFHQSMPENFATTPKIH